MSHALLAQVVDIQTNQLFLPQLYFTRFVIPPVYSKQEPIIIDSIINPKLQVSDQILEQYFKDMYQCIAEYNDDIAKLREYEQGQQPNIFELLYIIFSPFFLAIGLGWEFVKFFAKR
ncbi:hypothetical protein [Barnesiella intestinihominis]|uniref:hypothetical protein n=1 Tax=Barnesiella intestinihominis TaxID=487174 RepID=UPI003AB7E7E7